VVASLPISSPPSVLIFCGSPLVSRPLSQRIAAFGAFLARRDWKVRLTAVDVHFEGSPFVVHDPHSDMDIEVIGKTHYDLDRDGRHVPTSPATYLRQCTTMANRLLQISADMSADHVLLSTTMPASLVAAASLRRKHPSVWLDVDDWSAGQFVAGGGNRIEGFAYGVLERMLPRLAHHITVCSRQLQALFPQARFVPNFIRSAELPEGSASGVEGGPVRVAFASTVTGYYGHAELLDAIVLRRSDCSQLEVSIFGDGPALEQCRSIAQRGGISDLVRFHGQLTRSDMLDELARCDIGVLPLEDNRRDRARFPVKLLDYLGTGCSVAASNVGMAREILRHGKTALLSPPGNTTKLIDDVVNLAKDPGLRSNLAAEGRLLVRGYYEDVVCADWMELLSSPT
jgi:glycosyltransferase involved in cell wall biosynthesis